MRSRALSSTSSSSSCVPFCGHADDSRADYQGHALMSRASFQNDAQDVAVAPGGGLSTFRHSINGLALPRS